MRSLVFPAPPLQSGGQATVLAGMHTPQRPVVASGDVRGLACGRRCAHCAPPTFRADAGIAAVPDQDRPVLGWALGMNWHDQPSAARTYADRMARNLLAPPEVPKQCEFIFQRRISRLVVDGCIVGSDDRSVAEFGLGEAEFGQDLSLPLTSWSPTSRAASARCSRTVSSLSDRPSRTRSSQISRGTELRPFLGS